MAEDVIPLRLVFAAGETAIGAQADEPNITKLTITAHIADCPEGCRPYPHAFEFLLDEQQSKHLLEQLLFWKKSRVG